MLVQELDAQPGRRQRRDDLADRVLPLCAPVVDELGALGRVRTRALLDPGVTGEVVVRDPRAGLVVEDIGERMEPGEVQDPRAPPARPPSRPSARCRAAGTARRRRCRRCRTTGPGPRWPRRTPPPRRRPPDPGRGRDRARGRGRCRPRVLRSRGRRRGRRRAGPRTGCRGRYGTGDAAAIGRRRRRPRRVRGRAMGPGRSGRRRGRRNRPPRAAGRSLTASEPWGDPRVLAGRGWPRASRPAWGSTWSPLTCWEGEPVEVIHRLRTSPANCRRGRAVWGHD